MFMSLLAAHRCMLELKFAIYYRAASLPSQASYAVLAEESQAFFKHSPHTNSISNSAILRNNYISLLSDLCACVHVKKNGVVKEAIVLVHCSVTNAAIMCWNHRERVTQIWTSHSEEEEEEEEEEEKTFSGSVLSRCFLAPLGVFFVRKTLEDER